MIEPLLQRALIMGESCGTTPKPELSTDVVRALCATITVAARHANLYRNSVANFEVTVLLGSRANRNNHTRTFVTWRERLSYLKVSIGKMGEIM